MITEPIHCTKCNAPLPLLAARSFACPNCGAHVAVEARYKQLYETNVLEAKAHEELEARYARVSRVPSVRFDAIAIALVLLGPAIAVSATGRGSSPIDLFTFVIIPALLPGTALWMWSAAIHATVVRFRLALAAHEHDDKPCCRQCGAPLAVNATAIFARCAYCGTDSLVTELSKAVSALDKVLRSELKTIAEAITALAYRRRLVIAGIAIVLGVFGVLVAGVRIAA